MMEVLTENVVEEKSSSDPVVADTSAEAPAGAETEVKPEAESKPQEPDPALETKKALKGVQKRIDELTRARYEAEERGKQEAEYWRTQALERDRILQEMQAKIGPPQSSQFNDYEQYLAALAKHEATNVANQRINQERQQAFEAQQRAYLEQQARQAQANYQQVVEQKVAEAVKKFPDFIDVVTSPELPGLQGTPAFNAILESDVGAEVVYFLGKNPARAHQLLSLSPMSQIREIGRIEASIQSGKTVSNAPPPPSSVSGQTGGATKDVSRMTVDEYYNHITRSRRPRS